MVVMLKIPNLRYLQNRLANFDEILHDDILVYELFNKSNVRNPRQRTAAIYKMKKS